VIFDLDDDGDWAGQGIYPRRHQRIDPGPYRSFLPQRPRSFTQSARRKAVRSLRPPYFWLGGRDIFYRKGHGGLYPAGKQAQRARKLDWEFSWIYKLSSQPGAKLCVLREKLCAICACLPTGRVKFRLLHPINRLSSGASFLIENILHKTRLIENILHKPCFNRKYSTY